MSVSESSLVVPLPSVSLVVLENDDDNWTTWWMTTSYQMNDGTGGNGSGIEEDFMFDHITYVYFWLTAVTSLFSICGSVIIIATDVVFRDLRTPGRRLLTWLSIADGLTAFGNLIGVFWYLCGNRQQSPLCQFHALLTIFSSIASFLWTVVIATHLYLHVCRNNARLANRLIRPFHVLCWTLPAVVSVWAWSMDVVGYDESNKTPSWCWIKALDGDRNAVMFWQYMTGKAWEIACYCAIVCLYVPVKYALHKQVKKRFAREEVLSRHVVSSSSSSQLTPSTAMLQRRRNALNGNIIVDANRRLIFVPIVFLTIRIWGTIRFIIGAHWSEARGALKWIIPLQGVGDSSQGLANCIMFCFLAQRVRRRYLQLPCWRAWRCHRRRGGRSSMSRNNDVNVGCATRERCSDSSGSSYSPPKSVSDGDTAGCEGPTTSACESHVADRDEFTDLCNGNGRPSAVENEAI